ncbi:MAG TPA: hypothetical protein PLI09_20010 [Candidatus Hydrogenedentes bacterium]|nr:hypothetical protein [Candidatus Hydrogenedentota bacterium]
MNVVAGLGGTLPGERMMKHMVCVTKDIPAKAISGHPSAGDSLKGFFADPIGTIQIHRDKE